MSDIKLNFPVLRFSYINYASKRSVREVVAPTLFWGNSSFYPEDQWLMNAYDLDKAAWRTFALNAMVMLEQATGAVDD
jgi:predicted DNA-binding transcriptional regulator YafY